MKHPQSPEKRGKLLQGRSLRLSLFLLASFLALLSLSFLCYSVVFIEVQEDGNNDGSSRVLTGINKKRLGLQTSYQLGLTCPYCRHSSIDGGLRSQRTCQQRIRRLQNQNNGLGSIGAALSYLEAAIAVASRSDLSCHRCDPAACSDEDKRFYHMDQVGPEVLHTIQPKLNFDFGRHLSSDSHSSEHPDLQRMQLVNPSLVRIPQNERIGADNTSKDQNGVFLSSYRLINGCDRNTRGANSTYYWAVSILDATLGRAVDGPDGVFETTTEWSVVNEKNVLYVANAVYQAPLILNGLPSHDKTINGSPSLLSLTSIVRPSSPKEVAGASLHVLTANATDRHHRVEPSMLASILPSFGTSDELSDDESTTKKRGQRLPVAIACCAEVEWESKALLLGVAGYRRASSFFAIHEGAIVALTGKFCFTSECASHRIHSIVRDEDGNIVLAYEERCSSVLLQIDTADVMRMLFEPHTRFA